MSWFALALVLVAALLHAAWNVAAKKAGGNHHFVLMGALLIVVIWAPLGLWVAWDAVPRWGPREWDFFLEDLRSHHLASGGKIYFALNPGASGTYYTPQLRDFFLARGAKVERERVFFANGLR